MFINLIIKLKINVICDVISSFSLSLRFKSDKSTCSLELKNILEYLPMNIKYYDSILIKNKIFFLFHQIYQINTEILLGTKIRPRLYLTLLPYLC